MSHNPGNPGRSPHRGGGRGRGQGRGGRERSRGRPLNSSDRVLMYQMLGSLNAGGRRQLATLVTEFVGIPTGGQESPPPVERRETAVAPESSPKRVRIWDRDILKDVPEVREFAKKSSKERGQDTETSQRLSIATGAIARGRIAGIAPEDILKDLISHWSDADALHALYPKDTTGSASAVPGVPAGEGTLLLNSNNLGSVGDAGADVSAAGSAPGLSRETIEEGGVARKAQTTKNASALVAVLASGTKANVPETWGSVCDSSDSDEMMEMAEATSTALVPVDADSSGKTIVRRHKRKKPRNS